MRAGSLHSSARRRIFPSWRHLCRQQALLSHMGFDSKDRLHMYIYIYIYIWWSLAVSTAPRAHGCTHACMHASTDSGVDRLYATFCHHHRRGQTTSSGDALLVEGGRMVRCVACCRVDGKFGLLVRQGVLQKSSRWASQWTLQPETQWFELGEHVFKRAALWKSEGHSVIEVMH